MEKCQFLIFFGEKADFMKEKTYFGKKFSKTASEILRYTVVIRKYGSNQTGNVPEKAGEEYDSTL